MDKTTPKGILMDCCDTCRFYSDQNIGADRKCHRFPSPTKCPYSHWCGEFRKKTKSTAKTIRFVPPTLDQVKEYAASIKFDLNCDEWMDHYTSNGWKVGRNKMKDWRAAVRTWNKDAKKCGSKGCVDCFAPYKVGFKFTTVRGKKKYRCESCAEKARKPGLF